jgi:hypothetical protein
MDPITGGGGGVSSRARRPGDLQQGAEGIQKLARTETTSTREDLDFGGNHQLGVHQSGGNLARSAPVFGRVEILGTGLAHRWSSSFYVNSQYEILWICIGYFWRCSSTMYFKNSP